MKFIQSILCLVAASSVAMAAPQIVEPPAVEVRAERLESVRVIGRDASVAEGLRYSPDVTINRQGLAAGQSDISIRGSAFSGAGLSLAGIDLANAQTEHFNAELPLVADVLASPSVAVGIDQLWYGEGHLVGTVAFDLLPLESRTRLTLGVAESGNGWGSGLIQLPLPLGLDDTVIGVGVFGSVLEDSNVDSADNDVSQAGGGGRLQFVFPQSTLDVVVGHQQKTFGARGYYGVTDAWDAEESLEDTLVLGSWRRAFQQGHTWRISASRRRVVDDYALFWTLPGVFRNHHATTLTDGLTDGVVVLGDELRMLWRLSAGEESIRSSNLGNRTRTHGRVTLVPRLQLGHWVIDAGTAYAYFNRFTDRWLPQAAIARRIGGTTWRLAYSESTRQPSFTELNYESPASLGNAGLGSQRSAQTEIRVSGGEPQAAWHAAVFHRKTRDAVDWVRMTPADMRWTATAIGSVETVGGELGFSHADLRSGRELQVAARALDKSTSTELYSSRYVLDYPEVELAVSGWLPVCSRAAVQFSQAVRRQVGNPLRESDDMAYPASLALHGEIPCVENLQLTLSIDNLWDDGFEVFPGQRTTVPRRTSVSATLAW